jgi:hypothetical protein
MPGKKKHNAAATAAAPPVVTAGPDGDSISAIVPKVDPSDAPSEASGVESMH